MGVLRLRPYGPTIPPILPAPDLDAAPWPRLTGRGLAQMVLFYRVFSALCATTIAVTAKRSRKPGATT